MWKLKTNVSRYEALIVGEAVRVGGSGHMGSLGFSFSFGANLKLL